MKDRAKAIENQVQKHKHDIAKGLAATWAVSKVIEAWRDTAPNRLWTRQEAADWVRIHVPFDSALLGNALRDLWATGAVIGSDAADHALAVAGAADESVRITTSFDWSRWSPGNREAALIANPKGGFADRLASRNVVLKGIDKTTADRIGTVLSRGLEDGLTPSIVSTDVAGELIDSRTEWATTLEDRLQQVQDDFSRAETIARTEMNQAVADEVMNRYDELGVMQVQWNVIDPCDTCDSLDGQVVAFGEPFIADTKNGEVEILQPVVHPNCNCFLTPVIDDGSASADSVDMVDSADLEMSAKSLLAWVRNFNADLVKYSPDQLRDDNGRFTVDGGGDTYTPKGWGKIAAEELVAKDVEKFKSDSKAQGKELTEKDIKAFQTKSEKFYSKMYVIKNGSTIVYAPKPTAADQRSGNGLTVEMVRSYRDQLDALQAYAPLEHMSVFINPGGTGPQGWCMRSGDGSTIQLNQNSILQSSFAVAFSKDGSEFMPTETLQNVREGAFTLAHEWGHAFDNANDGANSKGVAEILHADPLLKEGLSKYSGKSDGELYAELFAQHFFEQTTGAPSIPATEAVKGLLK